MNRLKNNILMFLVATVLLCTVGTFGLIYSLIHSVKSLKKEALANFWADVFYHLALGIDKIGNVLLQTFLTHTCLKDRLVFPFGNIYHTISHVLAVNYLVHNNLTRFGKCIVYILEKIDHNHMQKSLIN